MIRRFSTNFALFSIGLDAILVVVSFYLITHLRTSLHQLGLLKVFPSLLGFDQPYNLPSLLYVIFPITWVLVFLLLSVYDGRKNLRVTDEFSSIFLGSILAIVSLAGTLYLTFRDLPRSIFIFSCLLAFVAMIAWRSAARFYFRRKTTHAASLRRVLLVGAGPVGNQVQDKIVNNPYMGLNVVGFLDDNAKKRLQQPEILGTLEDARRVVLAYRINDVVIALPRRAHERVNRLVAELHDLPVKVWVIPDYFQLALHKAVFEEFAGLPMLDLRAPALNEYQRMVKRGFDVLVTLALMPLGLLLMGICAIAIRLEGPGPVIFKQWRVGENGRLFMMYKFRTMVPNAEQLRHLVEKYDEQGKLIHKTDNDPRVTQVGRFLRKTSLDEMPQMFNILIGEMSWVGPRPELPYLVEQYEPWQRKRFAVPQGITGWWQVNGRSDKPMHLNTEDDLYYVQNYSLLLDIQILVKTVYTVLRGKGAY